MAVYLKPCHGCPIGRSAECAIRDEMRRRVSGLVGLRSASFRCARLADEIRVGRRVRVWAVIGVDYDQDCAIYGRVKATVTGYSDGKFTCAIDRSELCIGDDGERAPEKFRFRRWQPVRRIVGFLDEPDVPEKEAWEGGFSSDDEAVF